MGKDLEIMGAAQMPFLYVAGRTISAGQLIV